MGARHRKAVLHHRCEPLRSISRMWVGGGEAHLLPGSARARSALFAASARQCSQHTQPQQAAHARKHVAVTAAQRRTCNGPLEAPSTCTSPMYASARAWCCGHACAAMPRRSGGPAPPAAAGNGGNEVGQAAAAGGKWERLAASAALLIKLVRLQPYRHAAAPAVNGREQHPRARSASAPPGPCRWPDAA